MTVSQDDDDHGLFRKMFGDTKRIEHDRVEKPSQKPRAKAKFVRENEQQILIESSQAPALNEDHRLRHHAVSPQVFRRLRRGQFVIEDEIDLHGFTKAEAGPALTDFLLLAEQKGYRVVRIVHGKGHRSGPGGPILKPFVLDQLRRMEKVLAFTEAQPADGGSGASYVLLKKKKKP